MSTPVAAARRFTRRAPCPICGGHADLPQGRGTRCAGFLSADGEYAHCQREQWAGGLPLDARTTPPTYAHRLRGPCRCGVTHNPAPIRPSGRAAGRETRYELRDAAGRLMGVHVRVDRSDGSKAFRWERHNGRSSRDMPLWRLADHLAAPQDALRVVCEGERAAEALRDALQAAGRTDVVALGTVTGAAAIPGDESLAPLVGAPVALWPDNDEAGRAHMRRIAERLRALGAPPPQWIAWPDAEAGDDAADYLTSGGSVADLPRLVADAPPEPEGRTSDECPSEWDGGELLSEVTPRAVEWLWNGYIPLGKLTVGDGDPGLGKTLLFGADLAARVTRGAAMPDGSPGISGGAGVVLFTAEDDPADTLRPRLAAAGGDLGRVLVVTTIQRPDPERPGVTVERLPTFADTALIKRAIQRVHARLVVFDPFMAYLPSDVNSFRDQDVRSALAPLARLAQETGAAFVLIRHLNKTGASNALYRGGGSIGIIGAARSGLLVVRDPDDENARVFGSTKNNLGPAMPSWRYRIAEGESGVPHIVWEGLSERSAAELVSLPAERDTTSKLELACNLLREELAGGPRHGDEIEEVARERGISRATLRRARELVGVQSERAGFGRDGRWWWSLSPTPIGAHPPSIGAHSRRDEHLWTNPGGKPAQRAGPIIDAHRRGNEHLCENDEHLCADGDLEVDV